MPVDTSKNDKIFVDSNTSGTGMYVHVHVQVCSMYVCEASCMYVHVKYVYMYVPVCSYVLVLVCKSLYLLK